MPNIIEQQDLLKGLPDARLAMLLQNPVADIPPFLVAAEAQRRQSIRQQFAGSENKESVVDSLTKQLVPQNIKAQPEMTPPVPATPDMQGVAALQQQQQMQQAAQPDQGMAGGGPVRRFAGEGYVAPQPMWNIPNYGPRVYNWVSSQGKGLWDYMTTPYSQMQQPVASPEFPTVASLSDTASLSDKENQSDIAAMKRRMNMEYNVKPVDPGKKGTSPENNRKEQNAPAKPEEDFLAQIKDLYGNAEPSNWEKSQRWFDMAAQFLDPSKTTMQSVVGAGQAFAADSADLEAQRRAADLELKKAVLQYKIGERDYDRQTRAAGAEQQREAYKFYAEQAKANAASAAEAIKQLAREKNEYIKTLPVDPMTGAPIIDPSDPNIQAIDEQMRQNRQLIKDYLGQGAMSLQNYGALTGTDPSVEVYSSGDKSLKRFGG